MREQRRTKMIEYLNSKEFNRAKKRQVNYCSQCDDVLITKKENDRKLCSVCSEELKREIRDNIVKRDIRD